MSRRSRKALLLPLEAGPFPETVYIPLTRGEKTLVDAADAQTLMRWLWALQSNGYAYRSEGPRGAIRAVLMHRFLMNTPEGMDTDHINGDKLDNRRANLRVATRAQNNVNRNLLSTNTSGYKGVLPASRPGYWTASLTLNDRGISLGVYASKEEAARAVDQAAIKHFGEFARLNLPDQAHLPAPVSTQAARDRNPVAAMRDAPEVLRYAQQQGRQGTTVADTSAALGLPVLRAKRVLQVLRAWALVEPVDSESYYVTYRVTDAGKAYGE